MEIVWIATAFQSPSLRGSGRFSPQVTRRTAPQRLVSIPFIAGQWSLQFDAGALLKRLRHVSIPFIAGQWSLLPMDKKPNKNNKKFQSPSLRGSGRFPRRLFCRGGA